MSKTIFSLGRWNGIDFEATPRALAGTMLLAGFYAAAARRVTRLTAPLVLLLGVAAALIHWSSDVVHQLGHFMAGRRAGFPLERLRADGVLVASFYPRDEPELPPEIHMQRALGGAPVSLLLAFLGWLSWRATPSGARAARFLSAVVALENFLVFFLGAFLPLSWTDGGALIRWTRELRRQREVSNE